MSTKLYVGNLPYTTTESELQALFEAAGAVASINIVRDRATGQPRGFAFVEMSDSEGAQKAINELDRQQFNGRNLTVNEARWRRWTRRSRRRSREALVSTRQLQVHEATEQGSAASFSFNATGIADRQRSGRRSTAPCDRAAAGRPSTGRDGAPGDSACRA